MNAQHRGQGFDGVEAAWTDFRARLADALTTMQAGDNAFLEPESSLEQDWPNVCLFVHDDSIELALATADPLDGRFRLGAARRRRLRDLGFRFDDCGVPALCMPLNHVDEIAHIACVVLHELWDTLHPAFVTVRGIDALSVGEPVPAEESPADVPDVLYLGEPSEVAGWVDRVFGELFEHEPRKNSNGDIPINTDGHTVTVSVRRGGTIVEVWTVLAHDVSLKKARKALAGLHRRHRFVRFFLDRDTLVAAIDVQTRPLVPDHLRVALSLMGRVARKEADLHDELAHKRHRRDDAAPTGHETDPELLVLCEGFVDSVEWLDLAIEMLGGDAAKRDRWIGQARRARFRALARARSASTPLLVDAHERAAKRWRNVHDLLVDVRELDRHGRGDERRAS